MNVLRIRHCVATAALFSALSGGILTAQEIPPTTTAPAQPPKPVVIVEGQAVNSMGAGVKDAKVVAKLKKASGELEYINTATTNQMGDFKLMGPPSLRGTVVITMSRWGFKDYSVDVEVGTGELPPFVDTQLAGAVVAFGIVCDARTGVGIGGADIKVEAQFNTWAATSEVDGKFRVDDVPPGHGVVIVEAKGFGRTKCMVEKLEDFGELIVLLKPERIVHLQTVDDKGTPVPGVNIELASEEPSDFWSVVSDEQGRVVLRGVNADTTKFYAQLARDGYVASAGFDREVLLPKDQTESRHTLALQPAGSLTGAITDAETGEPLNGARIAAGDGLADLLPRAWSSFSGAYHVKGIAPGEVPVTVHLAGCAPELKTATIEAGSETQVDFALTPGHIVSGVAVDKDGKPVPKAHLYATAWRGHNTLGLQAMTDDEGRFAFHSAPADEFEISIRCKGHRGLDEAKVQGGKADYRFELTSFSLPSKKGKIQVGNAAPPLDLVTVDGKKITLSRLTGKWVLLDFWATWCGPCHAEVPNLKAVHAAHGQRNDFTMISISLDSDKAALMKFVQAKAMNWLHVFGQEGGGQQAATDYGADAIPLVIIIDPNGKIAAVDPRGPAILETVSRLLEPPPEEK